MQYTLDKRTTKDIMEDPLTKARECSRTWMPQAQVFGENIEAMSPQISLDVPSLINHHYISPETGFDHTWVFKLKTFSHFL